ncbi:MAG TPA: glycosyltransferase family 39 protein [Rhodocyclaceae bacterium]|nr:glycosyltransferase family 39 protein [Rhodocyclaceae bacterium]
MGRTDRAVALAAVWWLALVTVTLLTRPYVPVDETRYLAVAWEMRVTGEYLVPHLNGALYGHKPPLMFWLINAGWAVFGVNEWWPRLIVTAFGLAALLLTARIAALALPGREQAPGLAVLVTGGALLWAVFTTMVMFDLMLTTFAALAMLGLLRAGRGELGKGFLIFGLGIGLGVLSKGPAILLHTLPAALLAPLWLRQRPAGGWGRWYLWVLGGFLVGAAVALAWAVPAAVAGGEAFREEIFWKQSANRMVQSFAHRKPLWWYLPMLPLMLFPWLFWAPLWKGFAALARSVRAGPADGPAQPGVRFALAWALPGLLAFSMISGKQMQYLLPEFPAFGLLAAAALLAAPPVVRRWHQVLPAFALAGLAVYLVVDPGARMTEIVPAAGRPWVLASAAACGALAVGVLLAQPRSIAAGAALLGTATVGAVVALQAGFGSAVAYAYDVHPVARHLAEVQAQGQPVAHIGKYHGQFQFPGRLRQPLQVIAEEGVADWAARNPGGVVVGYTEPDEAPASPTRLSQRYRGQTAHVWAAADLRGGARTGGHASGDEPEK